MKRSAFTVVELIVVVASLVILAAILFPVLANFGGTPYPNKYRAQCQSNLKRIGLGFAQYFQDYNQSNPPIGNEIVGWTTLILPYIKLNAGGNTERVFRCPAVAVSNRASYFYNARLVGTSRSVKLASDSSPSFIVLSGDGANDQGPDYNLKQLPNVWRQDQNSPARRHLDGGNYLFADGHVKWFKPQKITLQKPTAGQPTFLVK